MKWQSDMQNIDREVLRREPAGNGKKGAATLLKYLGLAIGIALIVWFVKQSDPAVIWAQLQAINYRFVFMLLVTGLAYYIVSIAWLLSFPENVQVSLNQLFIIRLIGESLAQINPTNVIAGETLKAVLLKRKGVPYTAGIVSLTVSRFLIIISSVTIVLIGVFLFFDYLEVFGNRLAIILIIGVIFSLLLMVLYLFHSGRGIFGFPRMILKRFAGSSPRIAKTLEDLTEIDAELLQFYQTRKTQFFLAYLLSFLHRIVGAMEFYVILYFLGIEVTVFSCIVMDIGVSVFKALGSFVPGQIGIEEYGNKMMLDFVKVPGAEIWVTVSILKRTRQILWIGAGLVAFYLFMREPQTAYASAACTPSKEL